MDEMAIFIEKQNILELLAAYTQAMDGKDPDAWAGCFTTDGAFVFSGQTIRGRDRLREYAALHAPMGTRHMTSSPIYRIDDDGKRATGRATTVATIATRGGYKILFAGHYDDVLAKVDGRWLIAQRTAVPEPLPDSPELDVATADPDVAAVMRAIYQAAQDMAKKGTERD